MSGREGGSGANRTWSRESPIRQETPSNYTRATESDPQVFLRKSKGKTSHEPSKERPAVTVDSTESEGSDDEEPHRSKRKADTPWPLKQEKRIIGKEMLQKRATNVRKKEVTPESFSGDVNLPEIPQPIRGVCRVEWIDGEAENAATISGAQRKDQRSSSTAGRMEDNSLQRFGETFGRNVLRTRGDVLGTA